jgi:malate dehydrogenase (oxaloacetate-decarboxylating)
MTGKSITSFWNDHKHSKVSIFALKWQASKIGLRTHFVLDFNYIHDKKTGQKKLRTSLAGKLLLTTPQLNKSTAFNEQERIAFDLLGKLPETIETLEQQVKRCYYQLSAYENKLSKNIYLNHLHDTNQTLFYKLVSEHLAEMLPIIYTPIVGTAVKKFSHEYRTARGLYIAYNQRHNITKILANRSNPNIDLIVVTDGEGVLGIGDQGIGGMDIPIAKLMVYALCGGINPTRTLPIQLDVGTNNQELLDDPFYLGWRHPRLQGAEYDNFVDQFVAAVKSEFKNVFLHWEDFGRDNARRNLNRCRDTICTFNDDMQGTGVVTLSAIIAAIRSKKQKLCHQRIVVLGAGTAGTGISDQICQAMVHEGLTMAEAQKQFWLIDRPGLLTNEMTNLTKFQEPYLRSVDECQDWQLDDPTQITLLDVVRNVKPTILIGCSAVTGAFTETIVKTMAAQEAYPIILPLSNPTERAEATPQELFQWTEGKVLVATGSPFDPIEYNNDVLLIGQCNNALVFPGIGLGLIVSGATRLSDEMLWKACLALSDFSPVLQDIRKPLLPSITQARDVALNIAIVVAQQAFDEGVATNALETDLRQTIADAMWNPEYLPYERG